MRFKKVFSNLELEGQGCGIIMGVTRLLLLGPFYTIQTNFMYFFAHDCKWNLVIRSKKFSNICLFGFVSGLQVVPWYPSKRVSQLGS